MIRITIEEDNNGYSPQMKMCAEMDGQFFAHTFPLLEFRNEGVLEQMLWRATEATIAALKRRRTLSEFEDEFKKDPEGHIRRLLGEAQ